MGVIGLVILIIIVSKYSNIYYFHQTISHSPPSNTSLNNFKNNKRPTGYYLLTYLIFVEVNIYILGKTA